MIFWFGIIVGIGFAIFAAKIGFYEIWTLFFNLIVAVFLGVYLGPVIAEKASTAQDIYGVVSLYMLITAIMSFAVLYGISYVAFLGQFQIPFPRLFDTFLAGLWGFLTGIFVWSFICVLILLAPFSEHEILKKAGFTFPSLQSNVSYMSTWCNMINTVAFNKKEHCTALQIISSLEEKIELKCQSELEILQQANEVMETEEDLIEETAEEPTRVTEEANSQVPEPNAADSNN
jgi:hypothetical protein